MALLVQELLLSENTSAKNLGIFLWTPMIIFENQLIRYIEQSRKLNE